MKIGIRECKGRGPRLGVAGVTKRRRFGILWTESARADEVAGRGAQQRDARRVADVEKRRIGILQTGTARAPRSTVRHEVGKVTEEGPATQGNLDSTNHAQQGNQGFTRADTSVTEQGGKSFEMGVEKLEPRVRRKVRTLRPDIALARNLKERSNAQE